MKAMKTLYWNGVESVIISDMILTRSLTYLSQKKKKTFFLVYRILLTTWSNIPCVYFFELA
jgi:hypothetical protein